jgi:hypothetical protein
MSGTAAVSATAEREAAGCGSASVTPRGEERQPLHRMRSDRSRPFGHRAKGLSCLIWLTPVSAAGPRRPRATCHPDNEKARRGGPFSHRHALEACYLIVSFRVLSSGICLTIVIL